MRYYLYIDKPFLRTIGAILKDSSFSIEVVEYSVRKSVTCNNDVRLEPCVEKIKDGENSCREDKVKDEKLSVNKGSRDSCMNKERIEITYDEGNSYSIQTERKYLNIEDITNMKNIHFYHDMLNKLDEYLEEDDSRIEKEEGYIKICNRKDEEFKDNKNFFMVNDSYVWFDSNLLQGDISLLNQMSCRVNVIGYRMNCKEARSDKIIKAIAIYLE